MYGLVILERDPHICIFFLHKGQFLAFWGSAVRSRKKRQWQSHVHTLENKGLRRNLGKNPQNVINVTFSKCLFGKIRRRRKNAGTKIVSMLETEGKNVKHTDETW